MIHDKYQLNRIAGSPAKSFLLSFFTILMSIIFILIRFIDAPIQYNNAVIFNEKLGETINYELNYGRRTYLTIYFTLQNGDTYQVDNSCTSDELVKKLDAVKNGENISLAVNPDTGNILEITCGDEEILNFSYAQSQIGIENKGYFYIGIFMGVLGVYLLIHSITLVIPWRKKHKKRRR